jgi:hypothetical protein
MKKTFFTVAAIFIAATVISQGQINLKLGTDWLFRFNNKTLSTAVYDIRQWRMIYPNLFIEYNRKRRHNKGSFTAGIGLYPTNTSYKQNPNNPDLLSAEVIRTTVLISYYAKANIGFENHINRNPNKQHKLFYQYGLNFFLPGRGESRRSGFSSGISTVNGTQLANLYVTERSADFPVIPAIYGGLKCNFMNKKNRDVLGLELQASVIPIAPVTHVAAYTKNGIEYRDLRRDNGIQLQLTLVRRLWKHNKKK